ncbi:MAG: metallophosphoesterase family protein [Desulfatibacillaceae bacterium]
MENARIMGIMADSHGDADSIQKAVGALSGQGCDAMIHLGDVCDSMCPETADACVAVLREHGVHTLKGNNDHNVAVNAKGRSDGPVSPETVQWLSGLPWVLRVDGGDFAHSLPFDRELGLVAMVGDMQPSYARRYFQESPGNVLFRGHSHAPAIIHPNGDGLMERDLVRGEVIHLSTCTPCIITCGALTRGLCMMWDRSEARVTSLKL